MLKSSMEVREVHTKITYLKVILIKIDLQKQHNLCRLMLLQYFVFFSLNTSENQSLVHNSEKMQHLQQHHCLWVCLKSAIVKYA